MDSVLKRFNLAGLQQRLEALGVTSPVLLANSFDDQAAFCHQFRGVADASNLAACFSFCEKAAQNRASMLGRASSSVVSRPVTRASPAPPPVAPKRSRVVVSEPPAPALPVAGAD
eukprot:2374915-Karenia_brevis.AAC.1